MSIDANIRSLLLFTSIIIIIIIKQTTIYRYMNNLQSFFFNIFNLDNKTQVLIVYMLFITNKYTSLKSLLHKNNVQLNESERKKKKRI